MAVGEALKQLWVDGGIQKDVAKRLADHGLVADQPKVSKWERGTITPNLEQIVAMEDVFGRPHGWVLMQAGFVDADALVKRRRDDGVDHAAPFEELRFAYAEVARLEAVVRQLGLEPESAHPAPNNNRRKRKHRPAT
jgi:hypothetical protein